MLKLGDGLERFLVLSVGVLLLPDDEVIFHECVTVRRGWGQRRRRNVVVRAVDVESDRQKRRERRRGGKRRESSDRFEERSRGSRARKWSREGQQPVEHRKTQEAPHLLLGAAFRGLLSLGLGRRGRSSGSRRRRRSK